MGSLATRFKYVCQGVIVLGQIAVPVKGLKCVMMR